MQKKKPTHGGRSRSKKKGVKTLYTLKELKEGKVAIRPRNREEWMELARWFDEQGERFLSRRVGFEEYGYLSDRHYFYNTRRSVWDGFGLEYCGLEDYKIITVAEFFLREGKTATEVMVREEEAIDMDAIYKSALNLQNRIPLIQHDEILELKFDSTKFNSLTQKTMGTNKFSKLKDKVRGLKKNVRLRREYGLEDEAGNPTGQGRELVTDLLYREKLEQIDKYVEELESEGKKKKE